MTIAARMVPVERLLDDYSRQELKLKLSGAFAEAAGVRDCIVRLLRLADHGEPSLEPSEPQS